MDSYTSGTASADSNNGDGWTPYNYSPSLAAAVIFTVLFAAITSFNLWQLIRAVRSKVAEKVDKKRTYIIVPFILGGVCEFAG